ASPSPSMIAAAPSSTPSTAPSIIVAPAPSPPTTFDLAAIDAYIAQQVATRGFVGLSVAIVRDGVVVLDKGYGRRELSPDLPVEAATPFLVASISKQMVASLVLMLASEKKLSLDDAVAKWFPDLTRAKDITLYDLMTHVSGYPDCYPLSFVDVETRAPITPDESIARFAKRPLDFEPRTRFAYSSTGYKILGRVIEKVTGKPLGVVLEERIFKPVGMTHTTFMPAPTTPGLPKGYTSFAFGPPEPAEPEGQGWLFGSSGIHATAGDLAKWNVALMSGKVLPAKSFEIFRTPRRLADGRVTKYGAGIFIGTNKAGMEILQHSGRDSGFVGWSYMIPSTRSSVVVLGNRDDAAPWDLVGDLVKLLNDTHLPAALKIEGPSAIDVAEELFAQMQAGKIDRTRLGDGFGAYLTDAKIEAASARLRPLGTPTQVEVTATQERAGLEQAGVRFSFGAMKLEMLLTRSRDGKVQEFSIDRP
ncbi:MAG: serine hydrolase domain-containing protein, partial [Polyangiales bacterium]